MDPAFHYPLQRSWNYLVQTWADPLFQAFPLTAALLSVLSFLAFALLYAILDFFTPAFAASRSIRKIKIDPGEQWKEGIRTLATNHALLPAGATVLWPLLRHSGIHDGPAPGIPIFALHIAFFLLLDDFLFYWVHRLLHVGVFYRKIHAKHHEHRDVSAVSAAYFHPAEYLLLTLSTLAGPILLGTHVYCLYAWVILRQWIAAESHCGYYLPWNPLNRLPFYRGPGFHGLHHEKPGVNFGMFFPYMDRLLGTDGKSRARNLLWTAGKTLK